MQNNLNNRKMAKEIPLSITILIDPDLTQHVKRTGRKHEELTTGKEIPAKSTCYAVGFRYDGKLYKGYLTEENYKELIGE